MDWDIKGKYCLVTGASSGIGREIALGLAKLGARVTMVCRDPSRGKAALEYVMDGSGNRAVELMLADLSSQGRVKELAMAYRSKHDRLHVLVNNAGIIMARRELSVDGIEMTFAVNYLACFMLTNLLLDLLKRGAPARVVNMTSSLHKAVRLDFDNLQGEKKYGRDLIYAQSKLADIIFTNELARRLEGTGVTANSVCPGAVSSNIWTTLQQICRYIFQDFYEGPRAGSGAAAIRCGIRGCGGRYREVLSDRAAPEMDRRKDRWHGAGPACKSIPLQTVAILETA